MACSLRVVRFPVSRRRELITTKARRAWGGQWPQPEQAEHRTSNTEHRTPNGGAEVRRFDLWINGLRLPSAENLAQRTRNGAIVVRSGSWPQPRRTSNIEHRTSNGERGWGVPLCAIGRREGPGTWAGLPWEATFCGSKETGILFPRQGTPEWRNATSGAASQCGRSFIRCSMLGVRCSMFARFLLPSW
jgi:hypothetical protein